MINAKEMNLYRKLIKDYEPFDNNASNDVKLKQIITSNLLNIYNKIGERSENWNCIANGTVSIPILSDNYIDSLEPQMSRATLEEFIMGHDNFKALKNFYEDLGYEVSVIKNYRGCKEFVISLKEDDFKQWIEENNLTVQMLIL